MSSPKFTDQNGKVQEVYAKPRRIPMVSALQAPGGEFGRYRLQRRLRGDQDQRGTGHGRKGRHAPNLGYPDGKDSGFRNAIGSCFSGRIPVREGEAAAAEVYQAKITEARPPVGRGVVSERNCDAERSKWVCRFSRCGSIPPLLHITISEWRVLIARPDQSMNTHPPA